MSPLLDLHCHGALGAEFGTDEAGSRRAAAYHRAQGTAVVASLVSAPAAILRQQVGVLAPLVADGTLVGIHLEGPCLSPLRRGAHDPQTLTDPDPALVETLARVAAQAGSPEAIVHWTFAPELPRAAAFVGALAAAGIRPAIGHTDADAGTTRAAIVAITEATGHPALITHLFNGMPPLHHRSGGPAAAALAAAARGEAVVELIADGVHVSDEVLRMTFDLLGPERIVLISDATAATGLDDGEHALGGLAVQVHRGVARLAPDGPIAGSTRTLPEAVTRAVSTGVLDARSAQIAAAETPRSVLLWRSGHELTGG